jgi:hypothetical protein
MKRVFLYFLLMVVFVSAATYCVSAQDDAPPGIFSKDEYPVPYWGTGERFSMEVYETLKDHWAYEIPQKLPASDAIHANGGIKKDGKIYYQWRSWGCPSAYDSRGRYNLEKFVRVIEAEDIDAYFGQMAKFFTIRDDPNLDNCVGLYIFEDDYKRFDDALETYECTTNHTPFKVGDKVAFGPALAASQGGRPDHPFEVIGICENRIIAESTTGIPMKLSWEYFVRAPDS